MQPRPVAYSYIRFSTKAQQEGDSLRRQTQATADWCARNDIPLDDSLKFHDLGKSAFLGQHRTNPDRHALAAFLKMVEAGRVPRGSYLVIENLDRLTREDERAALRLWMDILDAGVNIVQLSPETIFRHEKSDMFDIMRAVMELSRGHGESKRKSDLITPAWAEKKKAAREGRPQPPKKENRTGGMSLLTHMTPAWIEEKGGKLVLIPQRAAAVKRIYELSAAGYGETLICQKLAAEGYEPFGRSGRWVKAYVTKILTDRRAVGEYRPRNGKRQPDGDPIPGYFPAVVSEAEWEACRGLAAQRQKKGRGRRGGQINLFQGLVKEAGWQGKGGGYFATTRMKHGEPTHGILINNQGTEGRARRVTFPLDVFERAVLAFIKDIDPHEILNGDGGPDPSQALAGRLAAVEASLLAITAEMDARGESPTLFKRLRVKEQEQRELAQALAEARRQAAHPKSACWGEAQSLIDALDRAADVDDARLRLRSALRRVVEEIRLLVVPRGRDRLAAVQVWFDDAKGKRRDYIIAYREARGNKHWREEGSWRARSLEEVAGVGGNLDLRDRRAAARLEKLLGELDPAALAEAIT
jgi:DNA invertase Pin-like site-specific DNA recombinase